MRLTDVGLSPKAVDLMKDDSRVIFVEGTTSTGKSLLLGIKFFQKVLASEAAHTKFYICATSVPVAKQMFIDDDASFFNMFSPFCTFRSDNQGGGARIEVKHPKGKKIIYFIGYSSSNSWRKLRGGNASGILAEEINLANDDFLGELFLRGIRRPESFLYCNSNGAAPQLRVYTHYLNCCRPLPQYVEELISSTTLKSTYDQLMAAEPKESWRYYHFGFDDNPTLTEEDIARIKQSVSKGSHDWLTLIEGGRGVREGAIFADYMTFEKNLTPYATVFDDFFFKKFSLGVDVGSVDFTVFTLNGFTLNYQEHVVIDMLKINKVGTTVMWEAFMKWFEPYIKRGLKIYGAFFDYAGGGAIVRDELDPKLRTLGIQTGELFKFRVLQRCIAGAKLFEDGRLIIVDNQMEVYDAFLAATWAKDRGKPNPREFGFHKHKDYVDSVEYGQSPFLRNMLHVK